MHEVEDYGAAAYADVVGVEVAIVAAEGVGAHSLRCAGTQLKPGVHEQEAVGAGLAR